MHASCHVTASTLPIRAGSWETCSPFLNAPDSLQDLPTQLQPTRVVLRPRSKNQGPRSGQRSKLSLSYKPSVPAKPKQCLSVEKSRVSNANKLKLDALGTTLAAPGVARNSCIATTAITRHGPGLQDART